MNNCLVWIFGRGASAACGLKWTVPGRWKELDREAQIAEITDAIRREMDSEGVQATPYRGLLSQLEKRTTPKWHHRFITTNWDYLLQREIQELRLEAAPAWLPETHVFHLNGTVEDLPDNANRSPFLLETDQASMREDTIEADVAFNHLMWQQAFVVVGMSFSCEMDRSFLAALSRVEDDLPIGDSRWVIINHSQEGLDQVKAEIRAAIPGAELCCGLWDFGKWVSGQMSEVVELGAIAR